MMRLTHFDAGGRVKCVLKSSARRHPRTRGPHTLRGGSPAAKAFRYRSTPASAAGIPLVTASGSLCTRSLPSARRSSAAAVASATRSVSADVSWWAYRTATSSRSAGSRRRLRGGLCGGGLAVAAECRLTIRRTATPEQQPGPNCPTKVRLGWFMHTSERVDRDCVTSLRSLAPQKRRHSENADAF